MGKSGVIILFLLLIPVATSLNTGVQTGTKPSNSYGVSMGNTSQQLVSVTQYINETITGGGSYNSSYLVRTGDTVTDAGLNFSITGTGSSLTALNIVSRNPDNSAVWLTGNETNRGTLKISHTQPAGDDSGASAISLDMVGATTKAQGIFINMDNSTGYSLHIKNATNNLFLFSPFDFTAYQGINITKTGSYAFFVEKSDGTDRFRIDTINDLVYSGTMIPRTTLGSSLGTLTKVWNNLYVNDILASTEVYINSNPVSIWLYNQTTINNKYSDDNLTLYKGYWDTSITQNITNVRTDINSNVTQLNTNIINNYTILDNNIKANVTQINLNINSNLSVSKKYSDDNLTLYKGYWDTSITQNITNVRTDINSNTTQTNTNIINNYTILDNNIKANTTQTNTNINANLTIAKKYSDDNLSLYKGYWDSAINGNLSIARTDINSNVTQLNLNIKNNLSVSQSYTNSMIASNVTQLNTNIDANLTLSKSFTNAAILSNYTWLKNSTRLQTYVENDRIIIGSSRFTSQGGDLQIGNDSDGVQTRCIRLDSDSSGYGTNICEKSDATKEFFIETDLNIKDGIGSQVNILRATGDANKIIIGQGDELTIHGDTNYVNLTLANLIIDNKLLITDYTNDFIGIGTNAPTSRLEITDKYLVPINNPAYPVLNVTGGVGGYNLVGAGSRGGDIYLTGGPGGGNAPGGTGGNLVFTAGLGGNTTTTSTSGVGGYSNISAGNGGRVFASGGVNATGGHLYLNAGRYFNWTKSANVYIDGLTTQVSDDLVVNSGSLCVGSGGCTAPATDGGLTTASNVRFGGTFYNAGAGYFAGNLNATGTFITYGLNNYVSIQNLSGTGGAYLCVNATGGLYRKASCP